MWVAVQRTSVMIWTAKSYRPGRHKTPQSSIRSWRILCRVLQMQVRPLEECWLLYYTYVGWSFLFWWDLIADSLTCCVITRITLLIYLRLSLYDVSLRFKSCLSCPSICSEMYELLRYMAQVNNPGETDKLQAVCSSVMSADKLMIQMLVFGGDEETDWFMKKLIDFAINTTNGSVVASHLFRTKGIEMHLLDQSKKREICCNVHDADRITRLMLPVSLNVMEKVSDTHTEAYISLALSQVSI